MTNRYNELNAKDQASIDELINAIASCSRDTVTGEPYNVLDNGFLLIVKHAIRGIHRHALSSSTEALRSMYLGIGSDGHTHS